MELISSAMEEGWGSSSTQEKSHLSRQSSLVDEGMKGRADPLLSQEPASVLPSYASLMDTDVGHDFSEDKLMKSGNLYSLYLLNSDSGSRQLKANEGLTDTSSVTSKDKKDNNGDTDEEIDVETDGVKDPSPEKVVENGHYDALFEGMPFTELKGKEVGPCSYCNLWRTIRFMSYCGRFPFCSVYCTKKFAVYKRERGELSEKTPEDIKAINKLKVPTLFENQKARPLFPSSQIMEVDNKRPRVCTNGSVDGPESLKQFDWPLYLEGLNAEAAPVKCFHHAPLAKEWKANLIGALVEVQNREPEDTKDCFWIARIIKVAGYKAKLRFEGYGMDSSHDFWIHLCKAECYPVNGAEKVGKQLKPPKEVLDKLGCNWREHTTRVAHSGSPTFSIDKEKLDESLTSPFKKDTQLEVVYKRQVSSTCVATIKKVVADRIYVQYENCKDTSKDFWFHQTSPLIHPVGWSQRVHHPLVATAAYKAEALDKGRKKKGGPRDAPWEVFQLPKPIPEEQNFCVGMKLEAIDPLKLGSVSVATVVQTLGDGYLMIAIDGCLHDVASWFCYHATSSSLLPIGFCEYHQIELVPPRGYEGKFDWDDYLKATNSIAAPVELFHQKIDPPFRVGQKVEAVDLIESGFICAATILKIAGPLLRVHFDGWDRSYDQWLNCQSPDIYPVGWCEMVGYPLQPPRVHDPANHILPTPVLKNGKKHKSTSSPPSHEKRKRSFSGSAGYFDKSESVSSMVDAIYSFSDTEDHVPPKPPKVTKKEKTDKQSKKDRKSASSKEKKSKSKSHSKLKHKEYAKNNVQMLLSQSAPNLGSLKTASSKKLKDALTPTTSSGNFDGTPFLESPLSMRLLPDSPLSSSVDSFTSLSNGGGPSTSLTPVTGLPLDPLQMSPLTSVSDSSFQSVLAKASCSSLMSHSERTLTSEDKMRNGKVSPSCPSASSSQLQRESAEFTKKIPFLSSKHSGSKHKSKKSKKSKKTRDKDKSKKEKKCKKKDKEKKRKYQDREKNPSEKKNGSEGKISKLAALLSLPGQINFPDNKPLINGFLNASNEVTPPVPPAPPKPPKIELPDHDPFAFETEEEIQERLSLKKKVAPPVISSTEQSVAALLNSVKSAVPIKKVATAKKLHAKKAKQSHMSVPNTFQPTPDIDVISQESSDTSLPSGNFALAQSTKQKDFVQLPSHPSPPNMLAGSPVSAFPKHQQSPVPSPMNVPKSMADPPTVQAPQLMELRKPPINIHPRDAQTLLRTLQFQDPNLYRRFLNLNASSAPFIPSRSSLPPSQDRDPQNTVPIVHTVPAPTIRRNPQSLPRLINPQGKPPVQNPEDMIMLQHAVPLNRLPSGNLMSKKQKVEQLSRLQLQDMISAMPRDCFVENLPLKKMGEHIGQTVPQSRPNVPSAKRRSPTVSVTTTAKSRTSPIEQLILSQGPKTNINPPTLVSPSTIQSPCVASSPHMMSSPCSASSPQTMHSPQTVFAPSPHAMTSPQFLPRGATRTLPSPQAQTQGVPPPGYPLHVANSHASPVMSGIVRPKQDPHLNRTIHKQPSLTGAPPGTHSIMHRLPPLETILKSLNSAANPISPTLGSDAIMNNPHGIQPASLRPNRPRLVRPHSFPDASVFPSVSVAVQSASSSFPSPTSPSFPYQSVNFLTSVPKSHSDLSTAAMVNQSSKTKTQTSSMVNFPTLNRSTSTHSALHKPLMPNLPTSPTNSQASCSANFKLSGFQPNPGSSSSASSKSGGLSVPSSPSSPRSNSSLSKGNPPTPRSKATTPSTPTESGPGCILEEFTLQRMVRPEIGIMNPWNWGICEVIQFLIDAGERGCVETFSKQNIDGRKFMSLTKDQIAKLTGMKVAPSLKIYQQIVRLRSLFPTPE
ncbi:nascent polypeptide-associated complex subunit alpha, muscle-specific form-like isoform X2 [Patiria miniata]|uniref:SAM domain-containing protein n=1 Tax=Patiria miniata TaxID=46514 RepID=A0A913ZTY5_PATMI|nr:nascent polypeptide-associated complex subunit alpha, muscle-specific form-like isoform X2 [Patiria miniata]